MPRCTRTATHGSSRLRWRNHQARVHVLVLAQAQAQSHVQVPGRLHSHLRARALGMCAVLRPAHAHARMHARTHARSYSLAPPHNTERFWLAFGGMLAAPVVTAAAADDSSDGSGAESEQCKGGEGGGAAGGSAHFLAATLRKVPETIATSFAVATRLFRDCVCVVLFASVTRMNFGASAPVCLWSALARSYSSASAPVRQCTRRATGKRILAVSTLSQSPCGMSCVPPVRLHRPP